MQELSTTTKLQWLTMTIENFFLTHTNVQHELVRTLKPSCIHTVQIGLRHLPTVPSGAHGLPDQTREQMDCRVKQHS